MDEGRNFPLPVTRGWAWENQGKPAPTAPNGADAIARSPIFVTIATADRAPQARIFARSARECHPGARLAVLVPDAAAPPPGFDDLYDLVLSAEQLSFGGLADMRFRYSMDELCFALKPWVIGHLLDRFADDPVYYFDADIELFTPLAEAEAALARGANLVLIPQILQPALDETRERALLRSGPFNTGFVAVAPSAQARAFVAWWCERARTGCLRDPHDGTYGERTSLELALSICDGVAILRHPGYNFAYWNASERPLTCLDGVWSAAGAPLRFIHYSRWSLEEQDSEQYLAGYFTGEYHSFADLFAEYRKKVQDENPPRAERVHGSAIERRSPSGEDVPEVVRTAYAQYGPAVDGGLSEVFARAVAVLDAPSQSRRQLPDLPISLLYDEIWQRHDDLRYRFAVDRESGRLAYLRWLVEFGAAELRIPAIFLNQARSVVDRARIRELEATDEAIEYSALADGDHGVPPLPASADTLAGLIAARDADYDRMHRQRADIRLLVSSNKSLRREVLSLRVGGWRDEETIQALEKELAEIREAHEAAVRSSRELAAELAALHSRSRRPFAGWLGRQSRSSPAPVARREILEGDGPFFERGFLLGETGAIVGTTVKRIRSAPSGTMIFGPYVNLTAGRYVVTIDARHYQRLPVLAGFKVDVVCNGAQRVVEQARFGLHPLARWRRFELIFNVGDGEGYPDFEIRIWARERTALEIGRIGLYQLAREAPAELPEKADAAFGT